MVEKEIPMKKIGSYCQLKKYVKLKYTDGITQNKDIFVLQKVWKKKKSKYNI